MNNADQPAFPSMDMNQRAGIDRLELRYEGLTKRELIAAIIMGKSTPSNDALEVLNLTTTAIFCADALLQQLETTKPKP